MACCDFQALQEAQEKQQLLIKQKLDLENKLANSEKDLQKVTRWNYLTYYTYLIFAVGRIWNVKLFNLLSVMCTLNNLCWWLCIPYSTGWGNLTFKLLTGEFQENMMFYEHLQSWPRLFKGWITLYVLLSLICRIAIYLLDSVIRLLYNWAKV